MGGGGGGGAGGTAILANQILGGPEIEGRHIYNFQRLIN
jgi:hypothetical protein